MSEAGLEAEGEAALAPVFQAVRAGDLALGRRLAIAALAEGREHPLLFNLRAMDHEAAGRLDAALADLERARALAPQDFSILNAHGLCLARLERFDAAIRSYEAVLALRPDFGPAWFNTGVALERLGETATAAAAYGRAVKLAPRHAEAWANLAWVAARRGDAQAVREAAAQALALKPDNVTAHLALAATELPEPAKAETRLRRLIARPDLSPFDFALAIGQLGDALDAQDRIPEAFAAYQAANARFREIGRPRYEALGQPTIQTSLAWLAPWAETPGVWPAAPAQPASPSPAGEIAHVFLIGFPRSGTTLIESALAAHPDVVSLEERGTLEDATRVFLNGPSGLAELARLGEAELEPHRAAYWKRVEGFRAAPQGRVFIDKNPFNTLKLPLIARLFPAAKILIARRDPRDVVLSGFRRRFNLNPSTYELLDLGRTAAFYDGAMRILEAFGAASGMAQHTLVYERLTADFEAEAKAACAFIGIGWRAEMADFAGRGQRGEVASASSAQISRGLFADGAGRWRAYRDQLSPVLPTLAPWVARFGYDAD